MRHPTCAVHKESCNNDPDVGGEEARSQLIGKPVVLTDGKAGTVENVWLDELHGLRVSIKGHKWPVSTLKLAQT